MTILLAMLIVAAPLVAVVGFALLMERRQARRRHEVREQIALTDALHARLGALVAPVVRRRGRAWQVAVAVPFERPAALATVLATVDAMFGPARYEVVLSRQTPAGPAAPAPRRTAVGRESLSWT